MKSHLSLVAAVVTVIVITFIFAADMQWMEVWWMAPALSGALHSNLVSQ